jgi:hypothetical protein
MPSCLLYLGVHQRRIQVQEDAKELLGRIVSLVEHLGDLPKSDGLLEKMVIRCVYPRLRGK